MPPNNSRPPLRSLIRIMRKLPGVHQPFVQFFGKQLVAAELERRLAELTDRQIGQLMHDYVLRSLPLDQPETPIARQAALRLFRSKAGSFEGEPRLHPHCPKCEHEMLLHFGIEEADFLQCTYLKCGYKDHVPTTRNIEESE